jgi:hypothetical protein
VGSWECSNSRLRSRSWNVRESIQYCSSHLFHPIHPFRGSVQYLHQETQALQLAVIHYVRMGYRYNLPRTRSQLWWIARLPDCHWARRGWVSYIQVFMLTSSFFPGCIYLLSMYYKRWELQQRIVNHRYYPILLVGVVLLGFNPRLIFRRSPCLCDCEYEWPWRQSRMVMDFYYCIFDSR